MEKSDDDVRIVRFGAADDSVRSVRPSVPLPFRAGIGIAPRGDHPVADIPPDAGELSPDRGMLATRPYVAADTLTRLP